MVFPIDREEEIHSRLISLIQDQIRKVVETVKSLSLLIESSVYMQSEKIIEEKYLTVIKNEEEAKNVKRQIEEEITKVGAILPNREDFLRLSDQIDKMADLSEGTAFRVLSFVKAQLKADKDILEKINELGNLVLKVVTKLREALLVVTLDAETFNARIKETEKAEKDVDEFYRNLSVTILQRNLKIAPMLLIREIASMLEDISDEAESAANTLRALSLILL
ncbi:MAG: DUF47 family protein [Nitrososphaerota archaeon]